MVKKVTYSVVKVDGLVYEDKDRGVAFLVSPEDKSINAKQKYDGLKTKKQGDVRARFDHWMEHNICDFYFHGFTNDPEHKHCFVFKWHEMKLRHRLYGFLFQPRTFSDPGYEVCILVSHAQKNTEYTDPSELNRATKLRTDNKVIEAIRKTFAELKKGE